MSHLKVAFRAKQEDHGTVHDSIPSALQSDLDSRDISRSISSCPVTVPACFLYVIRFSCSSASSHARCCSASSHCLAAMSCSDMTAHLPAAASRRTSSFATFLYESISLTCSAIRLSGVKIGQSRAGRQASHAGKPSSVHTCQAWHIWCKPVSFLASPWRSALL